MCALDGACETSDLPYPIIQRRTFQKVFSTWINNQGAQALNANGSSKATRVQHLCEKQYWGTRKKLRRNSCASLSRTA